MAETMFNKQQPDKSGSSTGLTSVLTEAGPGLSAAPTSARRPASKVASLIADDIAIEGNVRGDGELQVDGAVIGDVAIARLTIGETGRIDGSITADVAEVRGKVTGAITAKQVRLYASAHVEGDITHEQLTMEAGAYFQGRSLRFQRTPSAAAATPSHSSPSSSVVDLSAAS
jgi:cytoskeletal protein CcmA (bactofilin family)